MQPTGGDDSSRAGASDFERVRVLVVEDDWTLATALKRLLDTLGMAVVGLAATIDKAERLFAEHAPDVALVDVNLRGEITVVRS